jgi:hypothetical protein
MNEEEAQISVTTPVLCNHKPARTSCNDQARRAQLHSVPAPGAEPGGYTNVLLGCVHRYR